MKRSTEKPVVLCVDDDPMVLKSLSRLFHEEPVRIVTTLQPQLALEWVQRRDVGLLLTDQRMPGMAGTDLVEEVQRCSPRTACILLTGYAPDVASHPSLLQGVSGLISKPWDGPMLKSAVRQILHERRIEEEEDRRNSGE